MQTDDFNYELPEALIAQQPLPGRSDSRMLVVGESDLRDRAIRDLAAEITDRDLVVFNDTRVIKARLHGHKTETGGKIEILIERVESSAAALGMIRASKSPPPGTGIAISSPRQTEAVVVTVGERAGEFFRLQSPSKDWFTLLEEYGELPLPPYITRSADASDDERYQSLMASNDGAVAAPTASLHFDAELIAQIRQRAADIGRVTLHVGAGTFQPVRVDDIAQHQMHAEVFAVSEELVAQVAATRARGGRVIAIGTTVVRALESAAVSGVLQAGRGESRLFITPGYAFRVVDALLTNFHLPRSTLLMLVSAFAGIERTRAAYAHAVAQRYRFFSYGDAMWIPHRCATTPREQEAA